MGQGTTRDFPHLLHTVLPALSGAKQWGHIAWCGWAFVQKGQYAELS